MPMLKNFFFIALLLVTGYLSEGCQKNHFLDATDVTNLDEQTVFSDSARTMDFLTGIYSDIGFSFNPQRYGPAGLEAACDEADGPGYGTSSAYTQWAIGSINAANVPNDAWNTCYTNIRRVNVFFKNIGRTPMEGAQKTRIKAEARFLRAWYYFILVKHYAGVPIVKDSIFSQFTPITSVRNTFSDCVDYIVSACDSAARDLPLTSFTNDYGRITKGMCMALKAKILLYAASPLFNGGQVAGDEPLRSLTGYPLADPARWKKAADAAKDVIDLGLYKLHTASNSTVPGYGFYEVFTLRKNEEYILSQMKAPSNDLESLWMPASRGAGSGAKPYQELVDAFPMKNGLPITDRASGYDPSHPYEGRDPRFDFTIIHNESMIWKEQGPKQPVYTYVSYPLDGVYVGTSTGYFINKMLQDNVVPNSFTASNRVYPLIRYAEILLDYAEALNEYKGPVAEVYDAVELIRKRAGLDPYTLPEGLSRDDMRERIHNERRIELAFESQRFWDIRRWKTAATEDNKVMQGMEITRLSTGAYKYKVFDVRRHVFRDNMYLWPIPQSEIGKSPQLIQNTGW